MTQISTIYFGYDIDSFLLLASDNNFKIIGVATIPDLMDYKTMNPVDCLFKKAYRNHIDSKKSNFARIMFQSFVGIASPLYKKYAKYLEVLQQDKIPVLSEYEILGKYSVNEIDVFVVNNWWLLPKKLIVLPRFGCVNIHPSELPKYRGSVPTLWSLKNHDRKSAVTYIVLDERMDSGKIIAQHLFEINDEENAIDIERKIERITKETLTRDLKSYLSGVLLPFAQDENLTSNTAKFYKYMHIDFHVESSREIFNKVILYPYLNPIDICYFVIWNGRQVKLRHCAISQKTLHPGTARLKGLCLYYGCNVDSKTASSIKIRLFKDINIKDSLLIILNRNNYGDN